MTDTPVNSEMTDQKLLEIEVKELVGLQAQSLFSPHHPDQECGPPGRCNAMTDTPIDREAVERLADKYDRAATWTGDWKHEAADTLRALLDGKEAAEADAHALVAEAYEVAAITAKGDGEGQWFNPVRAIRALTPADAIAAREARDRRVWNDAVQAAASHCENLRGLGFADAGGAIPVRVGEAVAQTIRVALIKKGQDR